MAISKMKYVSIMGKMSDMDRILKEYITRYPIELESAPGALKGVKGIEGYRESNPHTEELLFLRNSVTASPAETSSLSPEEAAAHVQKVKAQIEDIRTRTQEAEEEKKRAEKHFESLTPFLSLGVDFAALSEMEFLHYRYGQMPVLNAQRILKSEHDENFVFLILEKGEHMAKCLYFCEKQTAKKVDALFASMQFDRLAVAEGLSGSVEETREAEKNAIRAADEALGAAKREEAKVLEASREALGEAYAALRFEDAAYRIRRLGGYINGELFVLTGWMSAKDAGALGKELKDETGVTFHEETPREVGKAKKPPTLLKNIFLFRHFEMFVKMYGMPSAGEIDPTPFVALTYAFLFGMMFGDLGQGLVLTLGGLLVYRWKKADLAAILSFCGIFSMFFGYMYGSFFGFEDSIVKTHWLSPSRSGDIMELLLLSVALGAVIITVTMIFHIINAIRAHQKGELLFDTNGVAGLIFYVTVVLLAAPMAAGLFGIEIAPILKVDGAIIFILAALCVLSIWLREPLKKWIQKDGETGENGGVGMFILESFFELFEIMLSYVTNSISFVRVGAFALSHAGMMSVVHMLSGIEEGHLVGSPVKAAIIMVLGNLLVMGLEGLVVGIQVLRLEFYEIFSRFYSGDGREFTPNTLVK